MTSFTTSEGRGLLASTGNDATARIWDPSAGNEVARLVTGSPVVSLVYGRDQLGPFLGLAGSSGELALIDLAREDLPNGFGS